MEFAFLPNSKIVLQKKGIVFPWLGKYPICIILSLRSLIIVSYFFLFVNTYQKIYLCLSKKRKTTISFFLTSTDLIKDTSILSKVTQRHFWHRHIKSLCDYLSGGKKEPPLCKGRWQPKADGGVVKVRFRKRQSLTAFGGAPFTQGSLWFVQTCLFTNKRKFNCCL